MAACEEAGARAAQALALRRAHDEVARLAGARGQAAAAAAMRVLAASSPLASGREGRRRWEAAVRAHASAAAPLEAMAADALRAAVAASASAGGSSRAQLSALRSLSEHRHALARPAVSRALAPEREAALAQLLSAVSAADAELEARASAALDAAAGSAAPGRALAAAEAAVAGVVLAQGVRARVLQLRAGAEPVLSSLAGWPEAARRCDDAAGRASEVQSSLARAWGDAARAAVEEGGGASMAPSGGALMRFDERRNMRVTFREDLVAVGRHARQLASMGFPPPAALAQRAGRAEQALRFSAALRKVAAFYNTMDARMLPCTKLLLLEPLSVFEDAVHARSVSWEDQGECAAYVTRLQASAERMVAAITSIQGAHESLARDVAGVAALDVLRQQQLLRRTVRTVRTTVEPFVRGQPVERAAPWLRHWDRQLYKALEASWRTALESLSESLPPIRCDLVLAGRRVAFRPPLEELRASYYRDVKRAVALPSSLRPLLEAGGDEDAGLFRAMMERNAAALAGVYRKAEILFARLARLRDSFAPWAAVGRVEGGDAALEALVAALAVGSASWGHALSSLRAKRKELERLPDSQAVDCVSVALGPLKAGVDDHLQRLADTLLLALRRSLVALVARVDTFVASGSGRLTARVESMADIAAAQEAFAELRDARPAMAASVAEAAGLKRQLVQLSHQAGGAAAEAALAPTTSSSGESTSILERVSALPDTWAGFERALDAFDDRVREERERLRDTVRSSADGMGRKAAAFLSRWRGVRPQSDADADWSDEGVEAALAVVDEWAEALAELEKEAKELRTSCEAFGMDPPSWAEVDEARAEVGEALAAWGRMRDYRAARGALAAEDWLGFRSRIFELQDFAGEWLAACRAADSAPRDGVRSRVMHECELLRRAATGLKYARGEPFRDEHWTVALMKLGVPRGVRAPDLTVGHLLAEPVLRALAEQAPFLKDLNSRAQGEVTIREALQELRAWAETFEFQLHEHTSPATGRATPVIREWAEVFTQIGDNQSLLQSLKESSYFKPFADQAAPLEARLGLLDECCQDLNGVQRRWVYLEPIFGRGALPAEQPRFRRVDDDFRSVMSSVSTDPCVFQLADSSAFPGLRDRLKTMVSHLERCQKALADFLELKRSAFPRFYFLGDDDLLEILGQSKDPGVVRAHMSKLFQGVHSVRFAEGGGAIAALRSSSGEEVPLTDSGGRTAPVATEGAEVEDWLTSLVAAMRRSLACSLGRAVRERASGPADLSKFPSQVLGLVEEDAFSSAVEAGLAAGAGGLESLRHATAAQLRDLTAIAASRPERVAGGGGGAGAAEGAGGGGGVPLLTRLKVKALVLDTIHRMDVLDQLEAERCDSSAAWPWHRQLRFYVVPPAAGRAPAWASDDAGPGRVASLAEARMVAAAIPYSYEYQGTPGKLVHTPLTDKCYLALTQGIAMGYGGNPYGPAGTGKTESVKALGGALGRQVLVFNCDEGIDFRSMGRIFTGLVRCGAWGCFDEFNRLKPDQLSAVSQQIQVIQAAIKAGAPSLELLGREIAVDVNAGIFVTMNPAGKGYGGRSKLPDNLKQLFRPVAMSKPDNELIAEVLLFAEGFREARALGRKVASLFGLSRELLGQEQHYDWGLRAMKTCLNTSGALLAAHRSSGGADDGESSSLIQAIRVNTLSKLTAADARRFAGLMRDVFPGETMADVRSERLEAAIRWAMTGSEGSPAPADGAPAAAGRGARKPPQLSGEGGVDLGKLKHEPSQVAKMLQLKESLDQRMGCVIVGPSGCGKSTLWRVLRAALERIGQKVKVHVMNPKAMPRSRLLGEMDPDTREWKDGVLTAAARQVVREPADVRSWIVCDGDVDPEWIESLNSVLDDNHLLTLPNGERISFGPNVNFLFETHDLRHASPATISRMGMIFLSDDDVDPRRIVDAWLADRATAAGAAAAGMDGWISRVFLPALEWVRDRVDPAELAMPTTLVATVRSGLSQVASATSAAAFAVGTIRGLGSNLHESRRVEFAGSVFRLAGESPPDPSRPLDCAADDATGALGPVEAGGPALGEDASGEAGASAVPTPSLLRNAAVLRPWFDAADPVVVVGPPGCGKSLLVARAAAARHGTSLVTLHCSAQTSPDHVVQKLRQSCGLFSSTSGRVFRPKEGDRLVLFLRGVDLPRPDKWGTCPLVAFLQQLLAFGGFYDESLEFLRVERVQIVASVSPQNSLGRHALSGRFAAAVRTLYVADPQEDELRAIASAQLCRSLAGRTDPAFAGSALPGAADRLAATMVRVWADVRSRFGASEHRHYVFTPRDVVVWADGLRSYAPGEAGAVVAAAGYEGRRVFRDKLVTPDERSAFDSILAKGMREDWGAAPQASAIFSAAGPSVLGTAAAADAAGPGSRGWPLLQAVRADEFATAARRGLVLYRREERLMRLHLFPQAAEQLVTVDRCLARPGGHMLLIGRPGVGRRSAVSLVAHMLRMRVFEPSLGRGFGAKQFASELKAAMLAAAVEDGGLPCVLFLPEGALEDDRVLEMANSLAASGEVPGLFGPDEADAAVAPLREAMSDAREGSEEAACRSPWELFVLRVRARLHVVVALDPGSPGFARRCEANPALLTACSVAWFGAWGREALEALPGMILDPLTVRAGGPDEAGPAGDDDGQDEGEALEDADVGAAGDAASLGALMAGVHLWCEEADGVPASPRDYVAMARGFRAVLLRQRGEVRSEAQRLESGLGKLHEAEATVAALRGEAAGQKAELKEKQTAADAAMTQITEALGVAADRRREVEVLGRQASEAGEATAARKAEVEGELGGITPILDAAREAVGAIDSKTLSYIRALKAPPQPIVDVLSGVLRMLGNEDTSWTSMRRFLGGSGVKASVVHFDPRSISKETRTAVAQVVRNHAQSFEEATIRRVLGDAAPLAAWVKACLKFSIVMEKIQPLEAELRKATAALARAQRELDENVAELSTIDGRVAELKAAFQKRTAEAETLRMQLQRTEDTLARARALLEKLGGEKGRWEATVKGAQARLAVLPRQALVAAAFMAYLPGSPEDVRRSATAAWLGMFSRLGGDGPGGGAAAVPQLHRLLASESEALEWRSRGLPDDGLSTENASVILHAEAMTGRAPLIVDPAGAATEWLVRQLSAGPAGRGAGGGTKAAGAGGGGSASLEVVAEASPKLQTSVELSARFGKTLVITEASGISPMLLALLGKDLRVQGARSSVMVGDKLVDYAESFRAFVCTRDPSVRPEPSAAALVTTVNFTVTRSGLEGQLLGATLREVMPTLESEKSRLLREEEALKTQLADLERGLIQELAASEGDLLENKSLVESLTQTKSKSADIASALEASAATAATIDEQRDAFRPLAAAGSRLFFLLGALASHNHMYQFSLADFLGVFVGTIRDTAAAGAAGSFGAEEAVRLVPELQRRVLLFVSRSLLKEDRLMLGLHIVHGCRPELFRDGEWELFTGQAAVAASAGRGAGAGGGGAPPLPAWAPPDRSAAFGELAAALGDPLRRAGLLRSPLPPDWDAWGADPAAGIEGMPHDAMSGLTAWQRLLVVRTLRPDRLVSAMSTFACSTLGVESVSPPPTTLAELAAEAGPRKPLLMITTAGADPTRDLSEAADAAVASGSASGGPTGYRELAMGGGQQEEAVRLLRDAAATGGWLCFKNLHLVTSWLPSLQQELAALGDDVSPAFRLWLSTECHDDFPPFLLQECLKVTFEAPPGLRRNLERTVSAWPADFVARGPPLRRHLLALLAWFHGLVQERRTYVPQGWTKAYEFSAGDLRAAASVIDGLVERAGSGAFPWRTLHGVLEGAIYGGRVDDTADARVLRAFVRVCFHKDLLPSGPDHPGRAVTGGVRLPYECGPAELAAFARSLPVTDSPKLFRLPANAERSLQRATSDRVVSTIVSLSAAASAVDGFDADRWREALGPVIEAWDTLRKAAGLDGAAAPAGKHGADSDSGTDPVTGFVRMEAARGAALLRRVTSDLEALRRVLSGREALTAGAQRTGADLMASRVPPHWSSLWDGPEEPRAWMRAAVARVKALQGWVQRCSRGAGVLGSPVRLGELFRPETFLNAVRQQTARAVGVAIDKLTLETSFAGRRALLDAGVAEGVIVEVESLLLQGATLGGSPGALQEMSADAPDLASTPPCTMAWVSPAAKEALLASDGAAGPRLRVPLYSSPSREKIVAEVTLPVGGARGGAARWVMAGVGVFVSGSE